jgi:hypothetical protein
VPVLNYSSADESGTCSYEIDVGPESTEEQREDGAIVGTSDEMHKFNLYQNPRSSTTSFQLTFTT